MTVEKLINLLTLLPPEAEVMIPHMVEENGEAESIYVNVTGASAAEVGYIILKSYLD